jgi:hypothetical protein
MFEISELLPKRPMREVRAGGRFLPLAGAIANIASVLAAHAGLTG